ncbi:hypothetical protein [Sphaerisporangium corydalis]|uniref:Uncharacterized protein n=1 Tax=Sphaerisporangium corydalis TaxID=1441875 RepID=A0ABV9ENZ7_9ACTN|nr:hypothetical protein [Sphaerisporangium corydalis]
MKMYPSDFEAAAAPVRITLLAALCQVRQADIIAEAKANEKELRTRVRTKQRGSYSHHYRRGLPKLLKAVTFGCGNEVFRPVMDALALLKRYDAGGVLLQPLVSRSSAAGPGQADRAGEPRGAEEGDRPPMGRDRPAGPD